MHRRTLINLLGVGTMGVLISGCSPSADTINIPKFPAFKPGLDSNGNPIIYTREQVISHIKNVLVPKVNPAIITDIEANDAKYVLVDHDWMISLIDWWSKFKWIVGVEYKNESFDCDNFARFLSSIAMLTSDITSSYKIPAQLMLGTISVFQKEPFGRVDASGGTHMLNFFVSEKGIFILEPQSNFFISYDKYPNVRWIYQVGFK